MWMVKNPEWFDVIVTRQHVRRASSPTIGAIRQGGMGISGRGANITIPEGVSMFEPIGGSAPQVHRAEHHQPAGGDLRRPDAARHARRGEAAARIEKAVMKVVAKDLKSLGAGKMGKSDLPGGGISSPKYAV